MDKKHEDNITILKDMSLFQVKCIPIFGVYGSTYTLMNPIVVMKSKTQPSYLPEPIFKQITQIQTFNNKLEFEYFHITLDGTYAYNEFNESITGYNFARVNMVAHSYIFYNVNFNRDHKTIIYPSLFTNSDYSDSIIKDTNENDGLRVNPINISDINLKREILLHKGNGSMTAALSPNNCAVLMNMNSPLIHCYLILFVTYRDEIIKCCIAEYVIYPTMQKLHLFNSFFQQISSSNVSVDTIMISVYHIMNLYRDYFLNLFGYYLIDMGGALNLNEFKKIFAMVIELIFEKKEKKTEESLKESYFVSLFQYNELVKFINIIFNSLDFPQFSEKYLANNCVVKVLNDSYLIELIQKWLKGHLKWAQKVFQTYYAFVDLGKDAVNIIEIQERANYLATTKILVGHWLKAINTPSDVFLKRINDVYKKPKVLNKNTAILKRILQDLLNGDKQNENQLLSQLDRQIEDYLYYGVWKYKGKLFGIHHEFGKLSFKHMKGLAEKYYCVDDEKYEIIEKFITLFTKVDTDY